ncbi:MAG TPA: penicillin acylase family protein [Pyrinomonadaceae bacterium]|nr:penicillin acylase family protein [Pyrinomonadaceae bacterium]
MNHHLSFPMRVLLLAMLLSIIPTPAAFAQSLASSQNVLQIPGLRERVTIRRDERSIPYISASNEADLYFAQGYITASDRLFQMDFLRRTVRGELAEVLGQAALTQDRRHRTLGYAGIIDATAAKMTPEIRTVLEAYANGVNAFIASRTDQNLPPEFLILQYKPRPWVPADSLAVGKLIYEVLSTTYQYDLLRASLAQLPREKRDALLPVTSPLDVLVVGKDRANQKNAALPHGLPPPNAAVLAKLWQDLEDQQNLFRLALTEVGSPANATNGLPAYTAIAEASNNWVVSGKRTVSGKPLLANDPHLPPFAPGIWYMTELSAPNMHVAGVTFPGAPGIVLGHNDHIAWGATNLNPDVQDLYVEKFDKDNPKRYLTPSGWREAEIRREEIKVRKGFTDASTTTEILDVTITRHGPIILDQGGSRYALRWPALDASAIELEGFFWVNRARNWKEFTAALSRYQGPTQNFVYADVDGHIGYYGAGRVPIRTTGDGSVPYDGSTDDGEWTGFIPFDKLPHQYDPPSGMIVTANQRVVGGDYPYFLTHEWVAPYRARRIFDLLSEKPKLTADDFRKIIGDTYAKAGTIFVSETIRTMKGQTIDGNMREALALFESWDGRLDPDSRAAPLVAQMRMAFRQRLLKGALGEELFKNFVWPNSDTFIDRIVQEQPREWLPAEFPGYADLLRASYGDAREALTKTLGADESKWTWGAMSTARFNHPLASAPLVGLQFTIKPFPQGGTPFLLGSSVNVGAAVSMRLIADPGNWDKTQHGIALGQSGNPTSPHWNDQLTDWRNVTPREFPFTEAAVAAATKTTLVLEPKK